MGDDIFQAITDHPEGLWISKADPENNFTNIKTVDKRINLYIPEVEKWVKSITPESEQEQLRFLPLNGVSETNIYTSCS